MVAMTLKIQFDTIPSIATIHKQLNMNTGLGITLEQNKNLYTFSHHDIEYEALLAIYDDGITIGIPIPPVGGRFYLLWALIRSLYELGGVPNLDWEVPEWALIRWDDRRWWHRLK